jgi:hypothetical protein
MLLAKKPKVNGGVSTGAYAHRNLQRTVKSSVLGEAVRSKKRYFQKKWGRGGATLQVLLFEMHSIDAQ